MSDRRGDPRPEHAAFGLAWSWRDESRWAAGVLGAVLALAISIPAEGNAQSRMRDDFERGLGQWDVIGRRGITTAPSGDPSHGAVLVLRPHGDDVLALARGSASWGGVRIEGEVLFPDSADAYLGIAYGFQRRGPRTDFGLVYIKSPQGYLLPNPHRDLNVSRTLYPEYRTALSGPASIRIGAWQRFRAEIVGRECHVYIGDMITPQLTFAAFELDSGAVGLQPRSVGADVWVDNVRITSIDRLAYTGAPMPSIAYTPDSVLTAWEVLGPLAETDDAAARRDGPSPPWRSFATDGRGAVVTGTVVDYHGPRSVAYFRTRVPAPAAGDAVLHLSTTDDLALWVNGRFHWFIERQGHAWWDFWRNPEHRGQRVPIRLVPGENEIVLRVRGGVYAAAGFFVRLER